MAKTVRVIETPAPPEKRAPETTPPRPQTPQEFYRKLVRRRDGRAILQRLAKQ
jgi:hypothetical protein